MTLVDSEWLERSLHVRFWAVPAPENVKWYFFQFRIHSAFAKGGATIFKVGYKFASGASEKIFL